MKITVEYKGKHTQTHSQFIATCLQLLIKFGRCHTVGVIGNGRARHYLKYTYHLKRLAYQLGIRTEILNDAPRKGQLGVYLKRINNQNKQL